MYSKFAYFVDDTATTEIYTLYLHDALPISAFIGGIFFPGGIFSAHKNGHEYHPTANASHDQKEDEDR